MAHLWEPGDRVNWDASSSRGYGYQPSIAAIVHRLGDKRVQIEVARKPPYEKQWVRELKWVDPLALRPRHGPVSALGEPLELESHGFKIGFRHVKFGTRDIYYGTLDGDDTGAPCHSPEHALNDARRALRQGSYATSLRTLIELFEKRGPRDEREVQQEQHARATLARIETIPALNFHSWDECAMQADAEGCQHDNDDGSPHYFEPAQGQWEFHRDYPLSRLLHEGCFATRQHAFEWFAQEIQNFRDDGMPERAKGYRRMLFEPIDVPIVLGEIGGKGRIWDGWHRAAVAIICNVPIRAFVGTPRVEAEADAMAKPARKAAPSL